MNNLSKTQDQLHKEDSIYLKNDYSNSNQDKFVSNKVQDLQYQNEIKQLKTEIRFLNQINNRIGKELNVCQIKLGVLPTKLDQFSIDIKPQDLILKGASPGLPFYGTELAFLAPLLTAYDDKIAKLEKVLQLVQSDNQEIERKSQQIVDDNMSLRRELEKKCQQLLQISQNGSSCVGQNNIADMFNTLEKEDMNERVRLFQEENDILLQKYKEISSKMANMERIVADKQNYAQEQNTKSDKALQQYYESDKKNQELQHLKDLLEKKLSIAQDSNSALETENQENLQQIFRLENELKLVKTQHNNVKKTQQEVEEKKSQEIDLLLRELDQVKLKERDYINKMITIEQANDTSKEECRRMKREVEQYKQDCEQLLKMMEGYENKVQLFTKKEENMNVIAKEQKEQVEDALLQRDRALLKEEQFERQIQNQQEQHREEQSQMKEQHEKMLENLRNKQKKILQDREDEISEIRSELNLKASQLQKTTKEFQQIKQENEKLQSAIRNEIADDGSSVLQYQQRCNELEERIIFIERESDQKLQAAIHEKNIKENTCKKLNQQLMELKSTNETLSTMSQQVTQENHLIKNRLSASAKEKQNLIDNMQQMKRTFENRFDECQQEFNQRIKEYNHQLNEAVKKEKEGKEKAIELLKGFDKVEDKLKQEYDNRIKKLEAQLREQRGQSTQLKKIQEELPTQDRSVRF